jgi:hypothetical protein
MALPDFGKPLLRLAFACNRDAIAKKAGFADHNLAFSRFLITV